MWVYLFVHCRKNYCFLNYIHKMTDNREMTQRDGKEKYIQLQKYHHFSFQLLKVFEAFWMSEEKIESLIISHFSSVIFRLWLVKCQVWNYQNIFRNFLSRTLPLIHKLVSNTSIALVLFLYYQPYFTFQKLVLIDWYSRNMGILVQCTFQFPFIRYVNM